MKSEENNKGISAKKLVETLQPGESLVFPIAQSSTIRCYVSVLNTRFYHDEKKWRTNSSREEGTIRVTRDR